MKTYKEYHVSWEADIKAESPLHAAMHAFDLIRDPIGGPGTFVVDSWEINLTTVSQRFPFTDWQAAVAAGETRLGYTDWVEKNLEEE